MGYELCACGVRLLRQERKDLGKCKSCEYGVDVITSRAQRKACSVYYYKNADKLKEQARLRYAAKKLAAAADCADSADCEN